MLFLIVLASTGAAIFLSAVIIYHGFSDNMIPDFEMYSMTMFSASAFNAAVTLSEFLYRRDYLLLA